MKSPIIDVVYFDIPIIVVILFLSPYVHGFVVSLVFCKVANILSYIYCLS